MSRTRLFLLPMLIGISLGAQNLKPRPLQLPPDSPTQQVQEGDGQSPEQGSPAATRLTPARQLAKLREQTEQGDKDAAFQLGVVYLIGQGATQDPAQAEEFFSKATMTPPRMCFVAEAYMETALAGRVEAAKRWAGQAGTGCGYWEQADWIATKRLDGDAAQEIALLKKGLDAKDDGYRRLMRARLGELLLTGTKLEAAPAERVAWVGEAARQRIGNAEWAIGWTYSQHPEHEDAPTTSIEWVRKSARYGTPRALTMVGQAVMSREIPDLSFLDGMAFLTMGLRQSPLSAVSLEASTKQLDPAQQEELLDALSMWLRVARETGAFYTKGDALRLADTVKADDVNALGDTIGKSVDHFADVEKAATAENPDAELRLAYAYEMRGELDKAEKLYSEVAKNGEAQLWINLAEAAGKEAKWKWARDLYEAATAVGSKKACTEIARIDGEGMAGEKDPVGAYVWLLRSETKDAKLLEERRKALSKDELKKADFEQAEWVLAHRADYGEKDLKAAEDVMAANQPPLTFNLKRAEPVTPEMRAEMKHKAASGDRKAAFDLAVEMLFGNDTSPRDVQQIERYATLGAVDAGQKAAIAQAYAQATFIDDETRGKYLLKWWTAVGRSRGNYEIAQIYNGKSDGVVKTDDEKQAVAYWQKAVDARDERWARLSRMKLGYCVVKGWTSGNKAKDAAWAHELAMEMMGKEFYQVAGEYSYGRELAHDRATYLRLAERGAVYNIDNAQGEVARGIFKGEWKQRGKADAYAWIKLQAVKQDTGGAKQVEVAEQDQETKRLIEARYALLLKTRAESGAYYTQDDPLRVASIEDTEARAKTQDPEAQLRLGALLEKRGMPKDLARAVALYRQIWLNAGQEVRLTWGRALLNGSDNVSRDEAGAEKWLWDAANAGSHEACRWLAVAYGGGTNADPVAAESWLELAGKKAAGTLSEEQKSAVAGRVADWTAKHPGW